MASAQTSPEERAQVITELERSRDALRAACPPPGSPQWQARENGQGWNVAQLLEHIVTVDQRCRMLIDMFLTQPQEPDWFERTGRQDALVPGAAVVKEPVAAPERLHPKGDRPAEAMLVALDAAVADLIAVARDPALEIKPHTREHPVLGLLNGLQWIRLAAYHTDRHRAQMLRCLASYVS